MVYTEVPQTINPAEAGKEPEKKECYLKHACQQLRINSKVVLGVVALLVTVFSLVVLYHKGIISSKIISTVQEKFENALK